MFKIQFRIQPKYHDPQPCYQYFLRFNGRGTKTQSWWTDWTGITKCRISGKTGHDWTDWTGIAECRISGKPGHDWTDGTGITECRISGITECRVSGITECRISGITECWISGITECRISGELVIMKLLRWVRVTLRICLRSPTRTTTERLVIR